MLVHGNRESSSGFPCALPQLKKHVEHAITGQTALGPCRRMANGAKAGFNRIRGPQTRPMRGRKRVERDEHLPVLLQTGGRLRILQGIRGCKRV